MGNAPQSPSRRSVLRRGGVSLALALSLAGCTGDVGEELPPNEHWPVTEYLPDLPVDERSKVLAAEIEEFATLDVESVADFVATLGERGIEFETVEEVADQLSLDYVESAPARRGVLDVLAPVAGGYAALVDAGFEARALELVYFDPNGNTMGVAEIATEWAIDFNRGALSAGEFGEHVSAALESRREPPEPDVAPEE